MKKKLILCLSTLFVAFMAIVFFKDLANGNASTWPDAVGRIFFSSLPVLLLFFKKIPFTIPLLIGYYLFLFSSFVMGAVFRFYDRFRWWDTALHFLGGIFMVLVGVTVFTSISAKQTNEKNVKWLLFIFVFSFSITFSVFWEILEFAGALLKVMEEDSGRDIMIDLIVGTIGACFAAFYAVVKKKK